jgi:hypothetical protein
VKANFFPVLFFYGALIKPFRIIQKSRSRLWENSSKGCTGPLTKIEFSKSSPNRLIFCTRGFSGMGNTNPKDSCFFIFNIRRCPMRRGTQKNNTYFFQRSNCCTKSAARYQRVPQDLPIAARYRRTP